VYRHQSVVGAKRHDQSYSPPSISDVGWCCVGESRAKDDQQEEDWSWREPDGWCAEMAVVSDFVKGRGIPPVSTGVGTGDGVGSASRVEERWPLK
jgi:hypothetical protein